MLEGAVEAPFDDLAPAKPALEQGLTFVGGG
jgi:hypothetical protein